MGKKGREPVIKKTCEVREFLWVGEMEIFVADYEKRADKNKFNDKKPEFHFVELVTFVQSCLIA